MFGCMAVAGILVSDISKEFQIRRQCVKHMETLDKAEGHVFSINIDKGFIERMILSLSLDCHASTEGFSWKEAHLLKMFNFLQILNMLLQTFIP